MKQFRHIAILLATTALVAGLLVWSFRNTDFNALWAAFDSARLWVAPFAALVGLGVFPIKALRWRLLLAPVKKVRIGSLFSAIMIGFMANCILSRLGEIIRAAVVSKRKEVDTATALASIALERIFDMATVILILIAALLCLPATTGGSGAGTLANVRAVGVVTAALFAVGVAFLVLLRLRPKATTAFIMFWISWMPARLKQKVAQFLASFLKGLDTLHSLRQVAVVSVLSLVHWMVQVLFFYLMGFCLPGFGLTFPGAMLVFSLVAFSVAALPLPGYLGVYQAGTAAAGLVLSLPDAEMAAYGWLTWSMNIPVVIGLGFICLWTAGLSLGDLRRGQST